MDLLYLGPAPTNNPTFMTFSSCQLRGETDEQLTTENDEIFLIAFHDGSTVCTVFPKLFGGDFNEQTRINSTKMILVTTLVRTVPCQQDRTVCCTTCAETVPFHNSSQAKQPSTSHHNVTFKLKRHFLTTRGRTQCTGAPTIDSAHTTVTSMSR